MIKLINGDCLEVMKSIPSGSVDLILTDPPYGISFLSWRQRHQRKIKNDGLEEWLKILPVYLQEFKRVLTETGCCCCFSGGGGKTPVSAIFVLEAIKHLKLIQTVVWKKTIGLGWRYRPAFENIHILSKNIDKYNFYDTSRKCSNVVDGINRQVPRRGEHPTKKPVQSFYGRRFNGVGVPESEA